MNKEVEKLAEERFPYIADLYCETCLEENHRLEFNYDQAKRREGFIEGYKAAINTQGARWVKASERLPELPDPLPPDTEDERGVLFVNRTHSAAYFWFPSYGRPAKPHVTEDGHWALDQYEWLEEQTNPVDNIVEGEESEIWVVIDDTAAKANKLSDSQLEVDFYGTLKVLIEKQNGKWFVINAVNGWGVNCFDDYADSKIKILYEIKEQTKEVSKP